MLKINERDEVLTLSSGGCNALNLLLHGAGHVVSVDCNPAQSALLELKATAIRSAYRSSYIAQLAYCIVSKLAYSTVSIWHRLHIAGLACPSSHHAAQMHHSHCNELYLHIRFLRYGVSTNDAGYHSFAS